jgi:VanZ family protein
MAAIFYMSSQSILVPEVTANVSDKLLHFVVYAGLAVLFCRALLGEGVASRPALWAAILLASAYGASDEYHQLFVPLRNGDLQDWFVDTIGACAGAVGHSAARRPRRAGLQACPGPLPKQD